MKLSRRKMLLVAASAVAPVVVLASPAWATMTSTQANAYSGIQLTPDNSANNNCTTTSTGIGGTSGLQAWDNALSLVPTTINDAFNQANMSQWISTSGGDTASGGMVPCVGNYITAHPGTIPVYNLFMVTSNDKNSSGANLSNSDIAAERWIPADTLAQNISAGNTWLANFYQLGQKLVTAHQSGALLRLGVEANTQYNPFSAWKTGTAAGPAAVASAKAYVQAYRRIVETLRAVPSNAFAILWNVSGSFTQAGDGNLFDPSGECAIAAASGNPTSDDPSHTCGYGTWGTGSGVATTAVNHSLDIYPSDCSGTPTSTTPASVDPNDCTAGITYVDGITDDIYDDSPNNTSHNANFPIYGSGTAGAPGPFSGQWWRNFATQKGKPFGVSEWALEHSAFNSNSGGGDDPTFIDDMTNWFKTSGTVGGVNYGATMNYAAYYNNAGITNSQSVPIYNENPSSPGGYQCPFAPTCVQNSVNEFIADYAH